MKKKSQKKRKCRGCGHAYSNHKKGVYGITFCYVGRCICTNHGKGF